MELLTPLHWKDYELLDCGDFEKLERFGKYITIRPEPQAYGRVCGQRVNGKSKRTFVLYPKIAIVVIG
jgi:hypothetical protein